MIDTILFVLWFFWPAGSANTAPVVANNIKALKKYTQPLDFGKSFRSKRIFGDHKTFRGLAAGIVNGAIIGLIQLLLARNIPWFADLTDVVDYTSLWVIGLGALMGFGALVGDAVKSFFKRQVGVQSGSSWFPFDQTDYIIGGLLVSAPFVALSLQQSLLIFVVYGLLHPVVNVIGWILGMKPRPF
jgi:CDP-2,3-bis-(O-geranylgeranyl)-sn-glycerol synthase